MFLTDFWLTLRARGEALSVNKDAFAAYQATDRLNRLSEVQLESAELPSRLYLRVRFEPRKVSTGQAERLDSEGNLWETGRIIVIFEIQYMRLNPSMAVEVTAILSKWAAFAKKLEEDFGQTEMEVLLETAAERQKQILRSELSHLVACIPPKLRVGSKAATVEVSAVNTAKDHLFLQLTTKNDRAYDVNLSPDGLLATYTRTR